MDKYFESLVNPYFARYEFQRRRAGERGIEWQFTFREWVDWWGDDIDRRGIGPDKLQMCRLLDRGPYHPSNVVKGYPRDNRKTAVNVAKNREQATISAQRKLRRQAFKEAVRNSPFYGKPPSRARIPEAEHWAKSLCRVGGFLEPVSAEPEIMLPKIKAPEVPFRERRYGFLGRKRKLVLK